MQNAILGNDQVAYHRRLAAHKSGCSYQVLLYHFHDFVQLNFFMAK